MTFEEAKAYMAEKGWFDGPDLYLSSPFIAQFLEFVVGDETAYLDGEFTADDLLAIAVYMKGEPK